ncbi:MULTISPECIES: hypothetical protein [Pseudomonas]|uniref:Uncharacterized protein n=1 Tax=Pseudomonas gingeri TaxID=117681 RepID=A0A7Y8BQV5_9PSED|nr:MULTISPECIES: hypothetical protein [Pseudomonas]MPQ67793.1 hypothetical protein [Pseudomonas sp. MWU12-2323]NWB84032.1 hypothetical protein [Pseudomonas gingeri]
MAKIKILAGDFLEGFAILEPGFITIQTAVYPWPGLKIATSEILDIRIISEASYRDVSSAVGLGLAGALALGPIGAMAGVMLAGDEIELTFSMQLRDGRYLLCAADKRTYCNIEAAIGKRAITKNFQ